VFILNVSDVHPGKKEDDDRNERSQDFQKCFHGLDLRLSICIRQGEDRRTHLAARAFVLSLVFLAIGLAVVMTVGGYMWWQTRELRRQMRARTQEQSRPWSAGDVIEGEVITPERTRR
jgi:hypothetical protein